ncbi:hypothetical protein niasHS_005186 [Heterodera schachtii]|uniref:Uncharacterized protein n=1 Tax=Heterodera schachtii TaxID=97005 RepID=A0ABD2JRP4_HETSC
MQLAFSFAARVVLCFKYFGKHHGIEKWQLNTLLSAYKILSAQNNDEKNDENGIYPFQIIQMDEKGQHLWAQFLSPNQISLEYNSEQQKYIR